MTEKHLSQLLDIAGDYCFLKCVYDYETPNSVTSLYHAGECSVDFFVTVSDSLDFARVYFYSADQRKNFEIRNKDGHIDWIHSSLYLRKDAKVVLDIPISYLYFGVRRILSIFEDDIPF